MIDEASPIGCEQVVAPQIQRPGVSRWRGYAPQVISLLVGILAWEILGRTQDLLFLPPFSEVVAAWWGLLLQGKMITNLLASLTAMVVGFGAAIVAGLAVGILMGLSRTLESVLDMYVNAFLSAPSILLVPVFFIFFGMGDMTRFAVVFWYSVFIIVVNTCCAIQTVDPSLVEMAQSFGANNRQLLWKVQLPSALPLVMAGIRLGAGRAVKGMINGEMFIALVGLGAMVRFYAAAFNVTSLLAVLLNILVVALLVTGIVQALDRRLTRWESS